MYQLYHAQCSLTGHAIVIITRYHFAFPTYGQLDVDSGDRNICRRKLKLMLEIEGQDPFWYNTTTVANNPAIEMSPCASGWCGKAIEGQEGDHLQATERMCLQRPPTDGQERCSETFYENKRRPIFMCFCKGDLCNGAIVSSRVSRLLIASSFLSFIFWSFR